MAHTIEVQPQNDNVEVELESTPSENTEKKDNKKTKGKPAGPKESIPLFSLWRFASFHEKLLVFIACILSTGIGALQPVAIIITGDVLNGGASTSTFTLSKEEIADALRESGVDLVADLRPTILKFVYFGIAILIGAYLAQALWVFTSERLTRKIRERYVQAILRQDIGWHDMAAEGSLTTRLSLDVQLIQDGVGDKFGTVLQSLASFVGGLVVAFTKGWKLSLVIIACIPILMILGVFLGLQIKNFITKTQSVYAHAGAIAEQAFGGIRTVYAFSLQKRFVKRYDDKLVNAELIDAKKGTIFGVGFGIFMFVLYSILGLGFWYGSRLVIKNEMEGGNVMVVFFSLLIGSMALMGIPTGLQAVTTAQGAAFKVYKVIERVPPIDTKNIAGIHKDKLEGHIEFRNVDFHYPSRPNVPILKGLTLAIKPGQTVAFVGPSGSGKSTSISLVQRFYDAIGGEVLIDGTNIKQYNLVKLREHIGLVGQEPVLFNMTIKENILMGATEAITHKRLIEVCEMANCHKFITMLPNGYDTQVGEHGGMLSGGQKQRIAIARALIKDPQILLLDEATSALDTASERIVQRALEVASKNRTTITIAHRLSTIRDSDLICVMDKGLLVEQGTHEELIAMNGVYTQLVEKQKIAMKDEKNPKEDQEEVEVFNVPNQEALLKKSASVRAVEATIVNMDEAGPLILPDGAAMTRIANAKRKEEKISLKARQKELPKFSYRRVIGYLSGHYHLLALGVFGAIIAGAVQPVFAFMLAKVIVTLLNPDKSAISPGPMEGANLYSFLFAVLGLGAFVGIGLQLTTLERTSAVLTRKLRRKTFNRLLKQEVGFYDMPGHSLGALTSRLATDASRVCSMVGTSWGELAQFISTIITGLVIALIQSPALTGIILAVSPPLIYAAYYQSTMIAGFEDKTRKAYEEASEVAAESIKEIRTVVALTRESWFEEKYSASLDQPQRLGYLKAFRDSIGFAFNAGAGQFMSALGFHMGMVFMTEGKIGFENLFICLMTVMITAQSVGRSSTFMSNMKKGKLAAINTFEFLDRKTAIDPDEDGYIPEEFDPNFSFQNISFCYPARPNQNIFTGEFNITGRQNQTLALVGPSGCGKSTTIGMLERWYDASGGVVAVGGRDVKTYQLKKGLRKHMALVGQEPVLFDMSIRENILWGMDEEDTNNMVDREEEMQKAAMLANIHGFVSSLPDGYNTRVGDKGSQLSGGQKQRIAIARALIRNPKILLLDEATSALDSESEKIVQEAIDKASMGRTTVTIAHRLSTIQNADQIAVVSGGKIVELGKHFELLELNGVYADLVRQQDLST